MRASEFNHGWTCRHLGEAGPGKPVTLPHDAMLEEQRTADAVGGLNISWFEAYDYLYEKDFTLTAKELQEHLELEFGGVYRKADVTVNGEHAMFRPYGYTNFYVDLDPYVHEGVNHIEVIARNADQPNSRWYSGSGIYRPVLLWRGPRARVERNGVTIRTLSLDPPMIEVTVRTTGDGPAKVEILDGGRVMAEDVGNIRAFVIPLQDASLWSPDHPQLYVCRVTYGKDVLEETFGIRTLVWGQDGLLLNGERVILHGACIHHDNGLLGAACQKDALERRIRLLKENGYNALRSAHNPCSKEGLEICDRLGMLVMDEYIDHWYIHKTYHDYVEFFEAWWRQDLTDMVEKDRNHPCVVLYSTGNEVAETAQTRGIALTRDMTDFLHDLDPTRPVTCGINIFFNFLNAIGFGQYSDEKAAKEAARNEKAKAQGKKTKERATGSKFFNDLAGILGAGFMKTGATLHGSDVHTRDAYANMDIAGYNYGEKRYRHDLKKYPERLILGSETFCFDAYRFWELAKKEPRLIGDFVWAGIDYLGETMIGSWEYSDYAPHFDSGLGWISSGAGRIDLTGKPLGEALYTKVAFELEQGPFICVRPICHEGKHSPSSWKMTNAMPSWSFRGFEGRDAYVEVYARAAEVELLLNGKTVGRKPFKDDCLFVFHVPYENGTLEAISYDADGKEIGRDCLTTAGTDTMLQAVPEEEKVQAGHLAFIRLKITDPEGITKVTERGLIHVSVENGQLVALGSACPYYERSYLDDTCDTYYGEALAIVEAGDEGTVTLTAKSDFGDAVAELAID